MNNKVNKTRQGKKLWTIIAVTMLSVFVIIGIVSVLVSLHNKLPSFNGSELNINKFTSVKVYDGLQVTAIGDYSGLFLEDGSDEIVTSVMMVVLENISDKDLQLARIKAVYSDFNCEFEATNIPAGESVVLLEKNCRKSTDDTFKELKAEDVVFFQENMSLMEEIFRVKSGEGFVELENISSEAVQGTTYVYYKNTAGDTLYGGITYRAKIEDVIPVGESARVLTNHFTEKNSEVMQIVNVK